MWHMTTLDIYAFIMILMNLSTRQMRAFRHVARTGSFTRAAELAHMTQAGLSILVREMERQLGVRLFDRTTRVVQLTAAGRRMAPVAERVLHELDGVTDNLGAEGTRPAGPPGRGNSSGVVSPVAASL